VDDRDRDEDQGDGEAPDELHPEPEHRQHGVVGPDRDDEPDQARRRNLYRRHDAGLRYSRAMPARASLAAAPADLADPHQDIVRNYEAPSELLKHSYDASAV
jgi:hypothetical protein